MQQKHNNQISHDLHHFLKIISESGSWPKKTNFIIFTPNWKKYNNSEEKNYTLMVAKLNMWNAQIFLGIAIDDHLDWKDHIDNLSNKIYGNFR